METRPVALDKDLLIRVRRRDPAAMNAFFTAFIDRVYGYVLGLTRNPVLADDILQDAFVRLHRAADRLDPGRDPAPWVFTVVTNTLRDHWRTFEHRHRGRMVDVDALWDQPSPDPGPAAHLEQEESDRAIHRALGRLAPADRELILLREYEGMDYGALGELLGATPEAVRQRYSRAVRRLGKAYAEIEAEGSGVR